MEKWRRILRKSVTDAAELASRFDIPREEMDRIVSQFPVQITPYYLSLIKHKGDPLYRQVVPDVRELDESYLYQDPLAEDTHSPVPNIVHRYPDRCLFLISHVCASYCRFCTRKRKVGDSDKIKSSEIQRGIEYIKAHPEIRDVILSGGDPLLLEDSKLENIIKQVRQCEHVEIIRIGSRVPCFLPQRITSSLVRMLKKYHPLYINVHFNHPDELTPQAVEALAKLADAGIPLGNQTVLLKDVNDSPEVMKKLMQKLVRARVRPYYIYQADMVFGTEHFRTRVEKGLEIIKALRGWTSGLAVPYFVIDAPGGGGKIPILPEYVVSVTDQEIMLRNYKGEIFFYRQPQEGTKQQEAVPEFACPLARDEII
ncbi:KamA family radical SAM protein [bacterium]|nr:KamA family radical SAM protein [bacterium]